MNSPRTEDRLYTAVVLAFLTGLVAIGLLGVPALLVAVIGVAVAALAIVVPRVLETGSRKRRRRWTPKTF
jgi:hypothetical protein